MTIFLLKTYLTYRPMKKVWADRPTALRFRVNRRMDCPAWNLGSLSEMMVFLWVDSFLESGIIERKDGFLRVNFFLDFGIIE